MLDAFEIIRQRIFIDHSSKAKSYINEEFTFRAEYDTVANIFIVKDHYLPNLRVYDSDGEELPLVRNDHTIGLLRSRMNLAVGSDRESKKEFLQDVIDRKKFVLWIKLPKEKIITKNEFRIITLEYDEEKDKKQKKQISTEYKRNAYHSVVYIIRKPEDYEFSNKPKIGWTNNQDDYKLFTNWKTDTGNPMFINETVDTLSITIRPKEVKSMDISYSFRAYKHVVFFPLIAIGLLSLATIPLFISHQCDWFNSCNTIIPNYVTDFTNHRFEFGIGIIAASFVVAGLIRNERIRHAYNFLFLIPVALSLATLI